MEQRGAMRVAAVLTAVGGVAAVGVVGYYIYSSASRLPKASTSLVAEVAAPLAAPEAAAPAPEAAKPTGFLATLQAADKPKECDFDFSKAKLAKPEAGEDAQKAEADSYKAMGAKDAKPVLTNQATVDAMRGEGEKMMQQSKVHLYVKGRHVRTDVDLLGIGLVTVVDASADMAYFKNAAASPEAMKMGAKNDYPDCDWFSFSLKDFGTLSGSGVGQGGLVDIDKIQTADGTAFTCKDANFGDDFFATAKVCDGKAFACAQARSGGSLSPDMAKFCGGS